MTNKSNKELVLEFYKRVVGQRNGDLIDHYVSDNYIQHSPSMKDGKDGLKDALEMLKQLPKPEEVKSPIILAIGEGEYVMLLLDLNFMGKHLCVADLFKVADAKIVEHWDGIQDVTSTKIKVPSFDVDTNVILTDSDKALAKKHLNLQQGKVHRVITEGNVLGIQSEIEKWGMRYASYGFVKIVNSKVVQSWNVEQTIPSTLYHNNGMF